MRDHLNIESPTSSRPAILTARILFPLIFAMTLSLLSLHSEARPKGPRGMRGQHWGEGGSQRGLLHKLGRHLLPPQFILRHLDTLEVTPKQIDSIKQHMKEAQAQQVDLSFDIQRAISALESALKAQKEEAEVLKLADQVMALETKMKRVRLSLALRVKSALTTDQVKTARRLMKKRRRRLRDEGRRGRGKGRGEGPVGGTER